MHWRAMIPAMEHMSQKTEQAPLFARGIVLGSEWGAMGNHPGHVPGAPSGLCRRVG